MFSRNARLTAVLPVLLMVLLTAACSLNESGSVLDEFGILSVTGLDDDRDRCAAEGTAINAHTDRPRPTLDWLVDHQNESGHWSGADYDDDSDREDAERTENIEFRKPGDPDGDKAVAKVDTYLTAKALLAIVGSGYDHTMGEYRETCRKALRYLREAQSDDGSFGKEEDEHLRIHAAATRALVESYGLSGDSELEPLAKNAVDYLIDQQVDGSGWGEDDKPDIVTTAECTVTLKSAEMAGLSVDTESVYVNVHAFLEKVKVERGERLTVRFSESRNRASRPKGSKADKSLPINEAAWIVTALLTAHRDVRHEDVVTLSEVLVKDENLPAWKEEKLDFLYWNLGTLALYSVGGDAWKTWAEAVSETLLDHQRGFHETDKENGHTTADELAEHGSWDAVDCWSINYGRVYSTAINANTLEVYYRYLRLYGIDGDSDDE